LTNIPILRPKKGRPTRIAAREQSLATMLASGVDPRTADPLAVLVAIMTDPSQPGSARVMAAREVLRDRRASGDLAGEITTQKDPPMSEISKKAIVMLDQRRKKDAG
jgi:hypothetical protein